MIVWLVVNLSVYTPLQASKWGPDMLPWCWGWGFIILHRWPSLLWAILMKTSWRNRSRSCILGAFFSGAPSFKQFPTTILWGNGFVRVKFNLFFYGALGPLTYHLLPFMICVAESGWYTWTKGLRCFVNLDRMIFPGCIAGTLRRCSHGNWSAASSAIGTWTAQAWADHDDDDDDDDDDEAAGRQWLSGIEVLDLRGTSNFCDLLEKGWRNFDTGLESLDRNGCLYQCRRWTWLNKNACQSYYLLHTVILRYYTQICE